MEKITDNEIIKALECCHQVNGCDRCPLRNDTDECEILNTYALDLLLRQRAEIERYKCVIKLLESDVATAKSEAIKSFWNELKERNIMDERIVSVKTGDNLVKEMTEDGK